MTQTQMQDDADDADDAGKRRSDAPEELRIELVLQVSDRLRFSDQLEV